MSLSFAVDEVERLAAPAELDTRYTSQVHPAIDGLHVQDFYWNEEAEKLCGHSILFQDVRGITHFLINT